MITATPDQADRGAQEVPAIGAEAVDDDAPGERPSDEDTAVRGEDAAEVRSGLEGRDEPVAASAMMPNPMKMTPRCSRTPCQTNQAPPISASAAMTNNPIDCRTCT